jgi:DNA-binding Lrp family transcriptional regulator
VTSLSEKAILDIPPYIKLDKLDITILRELSQAQAMLPARIGLKSSYREMAKKTGASAGTIRNRVEKMYSAGILSGSSVFVNPTIAGMKGGAYALDGSPTIPKTEALARLKTLQKILFIHNFRGGLVGISFVFEDNHALKELVDQFHAMCVADGGMFSSIEYPPCSLSFTERDWKLVFLLSEEGFRSYSPSSPGDSRYLCAPG